MKKAHMALMVACSLVSLGWTPPAENEVELVPVPGGTFEMGSESNSPNEKPAHTVTVKGFRMGRTEVTVGQWKEFVAATGYRSEAERGDGSHVWNGQKYERKQGVSWANPGYALDDLQPVTCVSWNDTQEYVKWLNGKTGRNYRLPTEAEWEYCCRAGAPPSNVGAIGWHKANSNQSAQPVGLKEKNALGLHDMLGGVWEWCQDWEGEYSGASQVDPAGPASGTKRMARGGGWLSAAEYLRASIRVGAPPDLRAVDLGFRLASD